ncbi:MAG: ATP--guanido phosphotransferase, partial [Candidatus Omnitrophica bacterium]|nr:ATP--guanido phosphotransferase [Candidatus Omnitrophota bacterium]
MFEGFIAHKLSWLSGEGPESNIVFSSRIRLARNISDFSFPSQATINQNLKILSKIKAAYADIKGLEDSIFVDMDTLSSLDKQFLLERHLISQEHT